MQEKRNCQNCKTDFIIEPDDFEFYGKINVPAPTFCPECRLQRRLIWMKGLDLFRRKCDLCGEMKLSMYHPDAPYVVYCDRCWWSDKWDARDYGIDYDSTKSFLAQWNELLHKTPILGLSIDKVTGELSPYTNHCGEAKNCYLIYYTENAEYCASDYLMTRVKNVYSSACIMDVENCYDSLHLYKSYNIVGGRGNNRFCNDCFFIRDCEGCHDCFGATSLKNGSYVFMGEQLTKEAYQEKVQSINLGSYEEYTYWKNKAQEYFKQNPPKPSWETLSQDVSGSYVFHSKNVHNSYDVIDAEDSKHLMLIKVGKVKDSYDYTDWGVNSERIYECMTVGDNAKDIKFTHESGFGLFDVGYSKLSTTASHHFGCVSIRKHDYCILNKQYTKEEFEKIKSQIIEDMDTNPYLSVAGHTYKYGEFFPPEFSPHAYNDSFANKFFLLNKNEAIQKGFSWYEPEAKEYNITMQNEDIPDNIKNVSDNILDEIIKCNNCVRGYRIIEQELEFLKKQNLPLPRMCPFCVVWEKVDEWVSDMKLHDRICDQCGVDFKTHYDQIRAPKIYCKDCYKKAYL